MLIWKICIYLQRVMNNRVVVELRLYDKYRQIKRHNKIGIVEKGKITYEIIFQDRLRMEFWTHMEPRFDKAHTPRDREIHNYP